MAQVGEKCEIQSEVCTIWANGWIRLDNGEPIDTCTPCGNLLLKRGSKR